MATQFTVEKTHTTEGQQCQPGNTVQVHYTGKLTNDQVFDSSHNRGKPLEFQVGAGRVIRGWDEGIPQLRVGEKAVLTCPSDYAYGDGGIPGVIPPKATLIFEVELVAIV